MHVRILGSAAGGGFPQWNCACRNCADLRRGVPGLKPRSQSCVAVSADGVHWCLLNASPDLRQQLGAFDALAPRLDLGPRNSPLRAVILTNADVDHIAGLLNLREGQPFHLFAAQRTLDAIDANPIFGVMHPGVVRRTAVTMEEPFEPQGCAGLQVQMFAVPGKIALYLENAEAGPDFGTGEGDVVGLKLLDERTGRFMCYVPGCAGINGGLLRWIDGASLLLFDGTLYADDEMVTHGLSHKTGARMGHISMSGETGSIALLADADVKRRVFIHLNNSNPVLREDSPEKRAVSAAGWEIAEDGLEFRL